MARIVDWDGKNVPAGLRPLPPGRYVIEPVDETVALTLEEEAGLEEAIDTIEKGAPGLSGDELRVSLRPTQKR